jgi:dipeptidyl aminopeptidase/acylaminoacyl peptidase
MSRLLFRHTGLDQSYGTLAMDSPGLSRAGRRAASFQCERVHFAAGRGICLSASRGVFTTFSAVLFDAGLQPTHTFPLAGTATRARVSPDGRRAAITVFVSGHSYAQASFSTETSIVDTSTGERLVANLEEFEASREGEPFRAIDFNYWGVTFADANRFYASLGTGGAVYLVEGDIAAKRVRVVREGVECPSLSPDNTRLAFKKRSATTGRVAWRLHVLDLATLRETPLAETRSVDDQVEWFDDSRILYALPDDRGPSPAVMNVWIVPANGRGRPEVFLTEATSPTVLR